MSSSGAGGAFRQSTSKWTAVVGAGGALIGAGALAFYNKEAFAASPTLLAQAAGAKVCAASAPQPQISSWTQGKEHSLYLWIHLKPEANSKACAKAVANLQNLVEEVSPSKSADEEDEVLAGVGFGPNFYHQVAGETLHQYNYAHRKGALGDMPSTGGDIFVHAKCNQMSKLFELCQRVMAVLPENAVDKAEDTYSFTYKYGRDLSGFVDGTENPADDEHRRAVATEPQTGGSYVITQKWIHDLPYLGKARDRELEAFVGRSREDSTEIRRKSITSHVARMTGGNDFQQAKRFEMVRQSQPWGSVTGDAGLFFIGYAASPANFDFMLDRMVGAGGDGHSDDIMRMTKCVQGSYWYFPGVAELTKLK